MPERVAVVFAGGHGTRLWPLSLDSRPKQFQPVTGDDPLLRITIDRIKQVVAVENIYISTLARFREAALECRSGVPESNLILEQEGKGPSTAFALAHARIQKEHGNPPVLSCPSDHIIDDEAALIAAFSEMFHMAEDSLHETVILAARPASPDPSLGYLTGELAEDGVRRATAMVEKPSRDAATRMINQGNVFWNTANYVARPQSVLQAYRSRRPYVMSAIERHIRERASVPYSGAASSGHELAPLFEVAEQPRLIVQDFGWSDIGTWPRLEEVLDAQHTSSIGSSVRVDSSDVLTVAPAGKTVVTLGVSNLLIVLHQDVVYVMDKEAARDRANLDRWRSLAAGGGEGLL